MPLFFLAVCQSAFAAWAAMGFTPKPYEERIRVAGPPEPLVSWKPTKIDRYRREEDKADYSEFCSDARQHKTIRLHTANPENADVMSPLGDIQSRQ